MGYIRYDQTGRSKLFCDVSRKFKKRDESLTKMILNITTIKDKTNFLQNKRYVLKNNFNEFRKEIILKEITEKREATILLNESVQASLKALEISVTKLQNELMNIKDNFLKATLQTFYDIGFLIDSRIKKKS